jgi:hypothetical protein
MEYPKQNFHEKFTKIKTKKLHGNLGTPGIVGKLSMTMDMPSMLLLNGQRQGSAEVFLVTRSLELITRPKAVLFTSITSESSITSDLMDGISMTTLTFGMKCRCHCQP